MSNQAQRNRYGFVCPVRGCPKKHNRRFSSVVALAKHMTAMHVGELEKRLKLKKDYKK